MRRTALFISLLLLSAACTFDAGEQPVDPDTTLPDSSMPDGATASDAAGSTDFGDTSLPPDTRVDRDQGPSGGDTGKTDGGATDSGATDSGATDMASSDAGGDAGGGLTNCSGEMVDLDTDPMNCGACDNTCDPVFGVCNGGECGCQAGLTACGNDNHCVDTDVDSNNCNDCGILCETGEACIGGTCECRSGLTRCNGKCVDTNVHPRHCGDCNESCGPDACRDGTCKGNDRCGIGYNSCQVQGGTACISGDGNPLYCDPGIIDGCGTVCAGDELCYRPEGFIQDHSCHTYRPGRGCTSCPCDDCGPDDDCLSFTNVPDVVFCVE